MPVFLVRHASAGDPHRWSGAGRDRPLDERGRRQALGLVALLAPYLPARVISSPAVRCVQTVAPLAEHLGLGSGTDDALYEGSTRAAVGLVREAGDGVVLCSHGDVIPYVLDTLEREDGWVGSRRRAWEKGSTWVLDRTPQGWTATYLTVSSG